MDVFHHWRSWRFYGTKPCRRLG